MTIAAQSPYPIGTPGKPWDDADRKAWRACQQWQRSYHKEVVSIIDTLTADFDIGTYATLDYGERARYPLYLLKSKQWDASRPIVLITGGVHGYETSGVHGALLFARRDANVWAKRANIVVVPCVSPWGYEHIQRWNAKAMDPNRSFYANTKAPESAYLMQAVAPFADNVLMHIDLHETTDTDETQFRPALAARDGVAYKPDTIPDGFYLCGDSNRPAPKFQQAIIQAVSKVTHIAPADADGNIIGSPVVAPGVIHYDLAKLSLCAGITNAPYRTTTEVYPDSPSATPEQCNQAQATAASAAVEYALTHQE